MVGTDICRITPAGLRQLSGLMGGAASETITVLAGSWYGGNRSQKNTFSRVSWCTMLSTWGFPAKPGKRS